MLSDKYSEVSIFYLIFDSIIKLLEQNQDFPKLQFC